MTIKQCIKENGWQIDADNEGNINRSMDVDIDFENNGIMDETQFRITSYDVEELSGLFADFCKENNISANTVESITIVHFYQEKV